MRAQEVNGDLMPDKKQRLTGMAQTVLERAVFCGTGCFISLWQCGCVMDAQLSIRRVTRKRCDESR